MSIKCILISKIIKDCSCLLYRCYMQSNEIYFFHHHFIIKNFFFYSNSDWDYVNYDYHNYVLYIIFEFKYRIIFIFVLFSYFILLIFLSCDKIFLIKHYWSTIRNRTFIIFRNYAAYVTIHIRPKSRIFFELFIFSR